MCCHCVRCVCVCIVCVCAYVHVHATIRSAELEECWSHMYSQDRAGCNISILKAELVLLLVLIDMYMYTLSLCL